MPLMTAADCVAFCFLVASAVAVAMAIWIPAKQVMERASCQTRKQA